MSQNSMMSLERISEEAYGDASSSSSDFDRLFELGFESLPDQSIVSNFISSGECRYNDLSEAIGYSFEPHELDEYLGEPNPQIPSIECDNSRALMNNLSPGITKQEKKIHRITKSVPLSQSVGVGVSQTFRNVPQKISIVNDLEETFRPRYKSDYFAQNGKSRRPRYVADRKGNHFITLRVLSGVPGRIRVDWLTVADKSGDRYSMPYRFQKSNDDPNVPDCNPIEVDITTDKNGFMKLYLVLIKSKQDELRSSQPLIPFQPLRDTFCVSNNKPTYSLNPKQLIQKYQLDQSQLAFTFCALSADGTQSIPAWDTTVYSTVLTEISPDSSKQKNVTCPNCSHPFQVLVGGVNEEQDTVPDAGTNKRKMYPSSDQRMIKKQYNLF